MIKPTPIQAITPKYRKGRLKAGETSRASNNSSSKPHLIKCNGTSSWESSLSSLLFTDSAKETPERKTKTGAHQWLTNLLRNRVLSSAGFLKG